MSFLHELRLGRVRAADILTYINNWRQAPMGSPAAQIDLPEYLGMTFEQYQRWVATGEIPVF